MTVEFAGTKRYAIGRRLGAGANGVVYEAFDRELERMVALKTLLHTDASAIYRLKKEFRSLADVAHPNLVWLNDLEVTAEHCFFTMELVDGYDFLEYTRDAPSPMNIPTPECETIELSTPAAVCGSTHTGFPEGRVNFDRLRAALMQLATGLMALHHMGKLHRDIKPSNVLVTREGRVVILDFGLSTEAAPFGLSETLQIVGTPTYMSPEQGAGLRVAKASDWYSVGGHALRGTDWPASRSAERRSTC